MASVANGISSGQAITIKKVNNDTYTFAVVMTGVPPGELETCAIGKDSDNPTKIDFIDKGKAVNIIVYAIEETKSINVEVFYIVEKKRIVFTRTIRPDGLLMMRGEAIKKDGSSKYFTIVYKRG